MNLRARVDEGGRVAIPAGFRRNMGQEVGDEVIIRLEDDEMRILTVRQAIKRAQEIVRRYVPADRSLVDELLAERRADHLMQ